MSYELLATLIESYLSGPFNAIPDDLQERITGAFHPMFHWDELTPEQRLSVALQYDVRNNPATAGEMAHYWNLLDLIDEKQEEIAEMAAAGAPLPTEKIAKKAALALYREELATLEKQFNAPYPVSTASTESQAAPVVAAVALIKPDKAGPKFNMTKAAMVAQHKHQWPTIERDMNDASTNGLAAAKAGLRGWHEPDALEWARANNKQTNNAKPANQLAQAMNSMGNLSGRKHTQER